MMVDPRTLSTGQRVTFKFALHEEECTVDVVSFRTNSVKFHGDDGHVPFDSGHWIDAELESQEIDQ